MPTNTSRSNYQSTKSRKKEGCIKIRRKFKSKEHSYYNQFAQQTFIRYPKLRGLEHTVKRLFHTLSQKLLRKRKKGLTMNTLNNMELLSTYNVPVIREYKQKILPAPHSLK